MKLVGDPNYAGLCRVIRDMPVAYFMSNDIISILDPTRNVLYRNRALFDELTPALQRRVLTTAQTLTTTSDFLNHPLAA